RGEVAVEGRRDRHLGEGRDRGPALEMRILERALEVARRVAEQDRAGVVLLLPRSRIRPELRELGDREADLDHARARLPALDRGDEVLRELLSLDEIEEGGLRVDRAHDDGGAQHVAALERHALDAALAGEDLRDARAGADLAAPVLRRAADRIGDGAHPAL